MFRYLDYTCNSLPCFSWYQYEKSGVIRWFIYLPPVLQDQVMAFMRDVFDFDKVRYTTIELLSDDVLRLARDRIAIASAKLAS